MPVSHFGLAEPPAQIHLAAVHQAGEIDEADEGVLQLDPELLELVDVLAEAFLIALEIGVDLLQFFGVDLVRGAGGHADAAEALLAFAKSAGQLGNVAQDRAEQRQHGVGFVDRVMLLGLGAFGSGHGAPLVTIGPPARGRGGVPVWEAGAGRAASSRRARRSASTPPPQSGSAMPAPTPFPAAAWRNR